MRSPPSRLPRAALALALGLAIGYGAFRLTSSDAITVDIKEPLGVAGGGGSSAPALVFLQAVGDDSVVAPIASAVNPAGVRLVTIAFRPISLRSTAEDVAARIDSVAPSAKHVVLAGRGVGAWMAAMIALDTNIKCRLRDSGLIAGVIGIRGTYDLREPALSGSPERELFVTVVPEADRAGLSPITYARANAPPFLLLNGGSDEGGWPRSSRALAMALEGAGAKAEPHVVGGRDGKSIVHWAAGVGPEDEGPRAGLGELVLSFVTSAGAFKAMPIETYLGVRQRWWWAPPLEHAALRKNTNLVKTRAVDKDFLTAVLGLFEKFPFEINALPGKSYEAIDLLDYLATRPELEVGPKGDYLLVKNLRDEQLWYARADLERERPVIVVGMDDETNLYRLFGYYRLRQAYSWKKGEEPMPMMIRPLGPFLHFLKEPEESSPLRNRTYAVYSLSEKSFRWVQDDPIAPLRSLEEPAKSALIGPQGCVKCHTFRGVGPKAHHALARDATAYGGFALALEEYPREVLRRFLFEQEAVAKSFDVSPLKIRSDAARALFDLVESTTPRPTPTPTPP